MSLRDSATNRLANLLLALSLIATANARIITVDDDAPADFNNIQAAIDDANDGDTVEIQPGTYTGPGNFEIRFNGKAITVRGTEPEDFDIVAETVVDCNRQGRGFVFDNGEDENSILSGLKIMNGSGYGNERGGGIRCVESGPVISKCIISNNKAFAGAGIAAYNANPVIKDCVVTGNEAVRHVGGIYVRPSAATTVENCIITNNTAAPYYYGGGIYHSSESVHPLTIHNCIISGNKAGNGAGICNRGDTRIDACTITDNYSWSYGGGICTTQYNWSFATNANLVVSNSIVTNNTARLGGPEIAVLSQYDYYPTTASISFCNIRGGRSDVYIEENNALYWGTGNIDADPCLADSGYWGHIADPDIRVEPNDPNAVWVDGGADYHLKSQAGRWNTREGGWAIDEVTSPCIDAGDPNSPLGFEPFPNGGRINMGSYGGTVEASKSHFGKALCETIVTGDINGDCVIDGKDFSFLAGNWLVSGRLQPSPATNPDPPDGAVGVDLNSLLRWQPGLHAISHDVYFGTIRRGTFQGNQTTATFDPGTLKYGTTYYWRVDERNADVTTEGAVWSFTTEFPPR